SIHMFAQLRKATTVTEKLKPMIQGPNLPLEVIEPLRIGTEFSQYLVAQSGNLRGVGWPLLPNDLFHELWRRSEKSPIARRIFADYRPGSCGQRTGGFPLFRTPARVR